MTSKVFCYHCRIYHPREQVRRVETKKGPRWRCLRTLEAAGHSVAERDAFGRRQTEANRAEADLLARRRGAGRPLRLP